MTIRHRDRPTRRARSRAALGRAPRSRRRRRARRRPRRGQDHVRAGHRPRARRRGPGHEPDVHDRAGVRRAGCRSRTSTSTGSTGSRSCTTSASRSSSTGRRDHRRMGRPDRAGAPADRAGRAHRARRRRRRTRVSTFEFDGAPLAGARVGLDRTARVGDAGVRDLMLLLGIDTATRRVGVVLASEQRHARAASSSADTVDATPPRHAETLAPAIDVRAASRPASRSTICRRSRSASGPGMFTGLRVGVTTAKVLAQALRIPVIPIPSLDLLAYPLRHARAARRPGDRRAPPRALLRDLPHGARRRAARCRTTSSARPTIWPPSSKRAARKRCCAATARCASPTRVRRRRAASSSPGPRTRRRASSALAELAVGALSNARSSARPADVLPDVPAQERRRDLVGTEGARDGRRSGSARAARGAHRADAPPPPAQRCCASRQQVYPRPWTHSLFVSELALRSTRAYVVAKVGRDIVGYAGLMMSLSDGHVTTIAVDPAWHRHGIGTRLLLALAREAIARGATALTLEVAALEHGRAGDVPAVRLHAGRRAQGLLRRHRRGRARHVGVRGRPAASTRQLLDRRRAAACRARPCTSDRSPGDARILGIETSCDETAAAVVDDGRIVRSSVVVEPGRSARALRRRRARGREPRARRADRRRHRAGARRSGRRRSPTSTRSRRCTGPGSRARCSSA